MAQDSVTVGFRPVVSRERFDVAGRIRSSLIVRPAVPAIAAPLIVVLHGSWQTGASMRRFSGHGFDAIAETVGAVVAYPDALHREWDDSRGRRRTHDIAFIEEIISRLSASGEIDATQVHLFGYSNGGHFAMHLLHERPDLAMAAGIVAATLPAPMPRATASAGVPMLLIHGTGDPVVPFEGSHAAMFGYAPRGPELGFVDTVAYFAARNGITTTGVASTLPTSGRTRAEQLDFAEVGRAPVRAITVHGGGHSVPNPRYAAPRVIGRTHHGFDSAAEYWRFVTAAVPSERP